MNRARVGLDAHMLGARETGNETYVRGLLEGLAHVEVPFDILLYHTARSRLPVDLPSGRFVPRRVRPGGNLPRVLAALPWAARQDQLELFHATTYTLPPALACEGVATVHDISFRFFPSAFSPRDRLLLSLAVPLSLRKAGRILTMSESSRRDIIRSYHVPEERVTAIPLAAGAAFQPVRDDARLGEMRHRYNLPPRYLLAVGNLQPRKNLSRLVEAFAELKRDDLQTPSLVLVGKALWRESDILATATRLGVREAIIVTGYVPESDLVTLYSGAECFIYPSLYEGFGLPPLEAMACGVPVITSATSSLPEVVGDAALTVDPLDVADLSRAIRRLLDDRPLRERLRAAGLARAATFSWAETARRTMEVYAEVLACRAPRGGL